MVSHIEEIDLVVTIVPSKKTLTTNCVKEFSLIPYHKLTDTFVLIELDFPCKTKNI